MSYVWLCTLCMCSYGQKQSQGDYDHSILYYLHFLCILSMMMKCGKNDDDLQTKIDSAGERGPRGLFEGHMTHCINLVIVYDT